MLNMNCPIHLETVELDKEAIVALPCGTPFHSRTLESDPHHATTARSRPRLLPFVYHQMP